MQENHEILLRSYSLLPPSQSTEEYILWLEALSDSKQLSTLRRNTLIAQTLREKDIALEEKAKEGYLDKLTGLYNRRVFDHAMDLLIQGKIPFGLLFIDLDNLKKINDTFGHDGGDEALTNVAESLKKHARNMPGKMQDIVARVAGDEFAIIYPHIKTQEELETITHRIPQQVAKEHLDARIPVTVSIGAALHKGGISAEQLLGIADASLYQAKKSGKNKGHVG